MMKLELAGRLKLVPRSKGGDPVFTRLGTVGDRVVASTQTAPVSVLQVFSAEEVVELVNRCLYQLEYQQRAHRLRNERERDRLREVKLMVRKLYGVGFDKATDEQVRSAVAELAKGGGK